LRSTKLALVSHYQSQTLVRGVAMVWVTFVVLTDCYLGTVCLPPHPLALTVLSFRPGWFWTVHTKCLLTCHEDTSMVQRRNNMPCKIIHGFLHSRKNNVTSSVQWTAIFDDLVYGFLPSVLVSFLICFNQVFIKKKLKDRSIIIYVLNYIMTQK